MNGRLLTCNLGLFLLAIPACTSLEESETRPQGSNVLGERTLRQALNGRTDFVTHIKPILEAKCAACHHQEALPGRMSLADRQEALRSGTLRGFILPGQPDASPLLTRLTSGHANVQAMPPVGETLTLEERNVLARWISQGAVWPAGPEGKLKTSPTVSGD